MNNATAFNQHHILSTKGCRGDIKSQIPLTDSIAYGMFLMLQMVLSAFGNTLVCLAIIRFRHLRTLTNSLIFSLAVTDLLTPFVRVIFIAVATFQQKWVFGCFWCKLSSVLGVFLCASSIMHLSAISIERFIVIKWPLRHRLWINERRTAIVLANIWTLALLLSLFPYFGFVETTYNFELFDCEILWTDNPKMAVILAFFFFLFPFIVMSLTYISIFKEVYRHNRRSSVNTISDNSVEPARRKLAAGRLRISHIIRREVKAVRIILVVIGVFFVLWLPFFVVTSVRAYFPRSVSGILQRVVFGLGYLNASCNWIIYSVMNREMRDAFKRMLPMRTANPLNPQQNNVGPVSVRANRVASVTTAASSFFSGRKRKAVTLNSDTSDSKNASANNRLSTLSEIPDDNCNFVDLHSVNREITV